MYATDQVGTVDAAVGHERSPMCTSTVQNTNRFIEANDDQINIGDYCVRWNSVFKFFPFLNGQLIHWEIPLFLLVIYFF